jgi:hypothetical protein
MPYYKFKETDIFYNRIEAHPKKEFFVFNSSVFLDNQSLISGAFAASIPNVSTGFASLYELNVDRISASTGRVIGGGTDHPIFNNGLIYPFITKGGSLERFRTITTASFNADFAYGDVMSGSYPLSSSIVRELFAESATRDQSANRISALRNTLNYYTPLSRQYEYAPTTGEWDKGIQAINLISIPSIFYGSSIKKGTINLKYYITGALIGEIRDENLNGELIQVGPPGSNGSGSVAGVALYNEGFLVLTGNWDLYSPDGVGPVSLDYSGDGSNIDSSWLYYAVGANDGITASVDIVPNTRASASYAMSYEGVNYVPVVTMLANAPKAELNYSNNPTYINLVDLRTGSLFNSSSMSYIENDKQEIKNTVKSPYIDPTGSYAPQTFISRVGLYDENKRLIGIAKVATPVKKTEDRDLTFKLKLDF